MKKYRPSNGDEGIWFASEFCANCIHGKYEHTGDVNDNPCEIFTASFCLDIDEKGYPEEFTYNEAGKPTCTAFKKWDWGRDDDGNFVDPPPVVPDDPNQLCMPFIFEEIGIEQMEPEITASMTSLIPYYHPLSPPLHQSRIIFPDGNTPLPGEFQVNEPIRPHDGADDRHAGSVRFFHPPKSREHILRVVEAWRVVVMEVGDGHINQFLNNQNTKK